MVGYLAYIWFSKSVTGGLALLSATAWLAHLGKNFKVTYYPMAFMMLVTVAALINLVFTNFGKRITCWVQFLFCF